MQLQSLLLACIACLAWARHDSVYDNSSVNLLQEIDELVGALNEGAIEAQPNVLQGEKHVDHVDNLYGGRIARGHDSSDSEEWAGGRHRPCPTRCIRPSSTCCRRTTTDKITTYILRRTTTTTRVTTSVTQSITTTKISATTTTSVSVTTSVSTRSTTFTSLITISRTSTIPNTTFTVSRTATTTLPNKTVISIVTQQIMPCFTQFETCFYNCPYYEIDPNCGSACKPTGQCHMPQQQQQWSEYSQEYRRPRQHGRRHHRGGKERRRHCKDGAIAKNAEADDGKVCKPCGEEPHPVICRERMPRARLINWDDEVDPRPIAGCDCRPPVYMPYDEDVQPIPEGCIINKLPRCMRDGHRHSRRHRHRHCEEPCPIQNGLCPAPCPNVCECDQQWAFHEAFANGYRPNGQHEPGCGCAGCCPNRIYVLPCATSLCSLQPTFAPIATEGCWNVPQMSTITVCESAVMAQIQPTPVTVTLEPNVFCTTTIICARYENLGGSA